MIKSSYYSPGAQFDFNASYNQKRRNSNTFLHAVKDRK